MEVAIIVAVVFGIAIMFAVASQTKQRWRERLADVAARYGMTFVRGSWFTRDEVQGEVDGFGVVIDSFTEKHGDTSTTYSRIRVEADLPHDMSLSAEGAGSFLAKAFRGPDVAVGDAAFDARAYLRGAEVDLVARMNAAARDGVEAVLALPASLSDGTLTHRETGYFKTADIIADRLDTLLDFARATRLTQPTAEHLADNAVADPVAGVRLRNLELLVDRFPDAAAGARAVAAGLRDPAPAVRVVAAGASPDPAALDVLAAVLDDPDVDAPIRLDAAWRLGERAPDHPALAAHTPWIVARLDGNEAYAVMAARALGSFATIAAVEPLLAHTRGLFKDGHLKDAARAAIKAIQARVGGVSGALSLADPVADGALSLVDHEA